MPNKSKLGLYFTPFGRVLDLIDDCIACAVDKLIEEFGGVVWQEDAFQRMRDHVRENLNETTVEIAKQVEQILTLTFEINKRLKGKMDFTMAFALSDIKAQAISDEILEIRYMIEELRVSLFAQQLGTAYPISDKRVLVAIQSVNN